MIHAYFFELDALVFYAIDAHNADLLKQALWIDLLAPTVEEECLVESIVDINIPTRDDMQEIEISSRLYKEAGILYMTAPMLTHSESKKSILDAVSFILTQHQLVTLRYSEMQTFHFFITQACKSEINLNSPCKLFIALLEAAVDRIADTAERIGGSLDEHSQTIFRNPATSATKIDFRDALQAIGSNGDMTAKVRESLIAFNRLASYFKQHHKQLLDLGDDQHLVTLVMDIQALSDHIGFLSNQISFLLNATLGMINITQTNIIKILSVAAVIFLPPTVVASIYGMNFHYMPELEWHYGFPMAVVLMVLSAFIPYQFFKWKKWM